MVNPEESAPGARRVFGRARQRESALGRAGIRAENSHLARRAPVRAWVERSGPRPLTMSTLLTAKRSEGLRISATAGGRFSGRAGRAAATPTRNPGCSKR